MKKSYRNIFIGALVGMAAATQAAEVVVDFATLADYGVTLGYTNGLDLIGGSGALPDGTSSSHTFSYDISGSGLAGGADSLDIVVTCTTNLTGGGGNGITAQGGGSDSWWDQGEDLDFEVIVRKAGLDVTSYYSVDLTGAALRWSSATTAEIAGTTVSGGGGTSVEKENLPAGETAETTFSAARLEAGGICQFSQLRFDIINTAPTPEPVEVIANMGTSTDLDTQGYAGGVAPAGLPNNTQPSYTFMYDLSGAGIDGGADGMEITVTTLAGSNLVGTAFGFSVDGGATHNWWEVNEDVSFDVKITKGGADVTGYYSVDLTGAAVRWQGGQTATLAGSPIAGAGGTNIDKSALPTGESDETSFTGVRDQSGLAQFSQLRFTLVNTSPVPNYSLLIANFGTDATLDSQGFSGGFTPDALPSGTATNHTFVYDVSGAGIAGAATLEVDVVSKTSANIKATAFGFAVEGGNNSWWDAGEDVDISVRVLDPAENDITSLFTFDLSGASLRWVDRDLDADAGTKVTATIAGESFDAHRTSPAIDRYDLAVGETNEASFTATRTDADDICQLSQIRLIIGAPANLPEPFDALTEPANLLVNGDFTQVENTTGTGLNAGWRVTGSNGQYPAYDGTGYADATGWLHYNNDPNNMVSYTGSGDVLDDTDKLDCTINTNSGRIALNSSWDYRNGMVAEDALSGVAFNPTLTYVLSVDARQNAGKDHSQTTFTAAVTTGADSTNAANAISGALIQVSPTTTLPTDGSAPYSTQFAGSELTGQVNVMFESINTEDFTAAPGATNWPAVGSVDPQAADEMSQLFVYSVSLTFIPAEGDVDRDGFVTPDDVALANLYLAGDGGDDAATRQAALTSIGYSDAGALAYLQLTAFDIDGDNVFDAADVTALEAMIPPPTVQATMNGSSMDISWNSLPGKVYDLESVSMLSGSWSAYEGNTNIPADLSGTTSVTNLPVADPARFFRVIEK